MNHFKVVGCAALLSGLALIGQAAGAENALLVLATPPTHRVAP
jgi:hypothetical protein